jgi:hypothetical protein
MTERILPIFEKNIKNEPHSYIWDWCYNHSSQVEMNQTN